MEKVVLIVRKILIVLLVLWMIGVFLLSNQNGEDSGSFSGKVSLLICFGNEQKAEAIEPVIRKVAHMVEFAVGAMIFYGILSTYYVSFKKRIIFTILFIILSASLDETHQLFISERSGSILDVLIDTSGGVLGIGSIWIIEKSIKLIDSKVQESLNKI